MSVNRKNPSLEEMWRVIESIGIKREIVGQSFSTYEDVAELYYIVEKKIHDQREQEMIRCLKAYIEKQINEEFLKSLENVSQNARESE